jgi:hypothetical protein
MHNVDHLDAVFETNCMTVTDHLFEINNSHIYDRRAICTMYKCRVWSFRFGAQPSTTIAYVVYSCSLFLEKYTISQRANARLHLPFWKPFRTLTDICPAAPYPSLTSTAVIRRFSGQSHSFHCPQAVTTICIWNMSQQREPLFWSFSHGHWKPRSDQPLAPSDYCQYSSLVRKLEHNSYPSPGTLRFVQAGSITEYLPVISGTIVVRSDYAYTSSYKWADARPKYRNPRPPAFGSTPTHMSMHPDEHRKKANKIDRFETRRCMKN